MEVTHLFAGLAVSDGDRAWQWYERLWGRPPARRPTAGEAVWELAPGALVYVVVDPARAGRGLATLAVDDLAATLTGLAEQGIAVATETLANGLVKATASDPDGNTIAFFEHARSASERSP